MRSKTGQGVECEIRERSDSLIQKQQIILIDKGRIQEGIPARRKLFFKCSSSGNYVQNSKTGYQEILYFGVKIRKWKTSRDKKNKLKRFQRYYLQQ